jgi:hypothetical protein
MNDEQQQKSELNFIPSDQEFQIYEKQITETTIQKSTIHTCMLYRKKKRKKSALIKK